MSDDTAGENRRQNRETAQRASHFDFPRSEDAAGLNSGLRNQSQVLQKTVGRRRAGRSLLRTVQEEAERLNRFINNLLDMTRGLPIRVRDEADRCIEGKDRFHAGLRLRVEWQIPLEALQQIECDEAGSTEEDQRYPVLIPAAALPRRCAHPFGGDALKKRDGALYRVEARFYPQAVLRAARPLSGGARLTQVLHD
jgi:hypothetical protein